MKMAANEGVDFYLGKFVKVFCEDKMEIEGTLINVDKYGNLEIVHTENGERDKFTIFRPKIIAVKTVLEKKI